MREEGERGGAKGKAKFALFFTPPRLFPRLLFPLALFAPHIFSLTCQSLTGALYSTKERERIREKKQNKKLVPLFDNSQTKTNKHARAHFREGVARPSSPQQTPCTLTERERENLENLSQPENRERGREREFRWRKEGLFPHRVEERDFLSLLLPPPVPFRRQKLGYIPIPLASRSYYVEI